MALIEIRSLVKTFGDQTILNGVDLDVSEGNVKVVMGPSGCGKSTLLRCLNRLVEPTAGSIVFRGEDITRAETDVRALRQSIGFVFQQFALYRHLTVRDNVTLALRKLRGMRRAQANEKALHELDRLGMANHQDKYPSQISGGQKQRVALARALAMDPAVVVLDEPTSALDPVMSREVATLIQRLHSEGVTMLCVTHDLLLASHISDQVAFLDQGVIRAEDSVEHLSRHHPDLEIRAFFGSVEQAGSEGNAG
jgi:polar amino acid transport system ATP-binding protein